MNREINSLRSPSGVRRHNSNKRTKPGSTLLMDYSKDKAILGGSDNSNGSLRRPRRTAMTVGFSDQDPIEKQYNERLDKKTELPKEATAAVTFRIRKNTFTRSNSSPLLRGTAAAEDTAPLPTSSYHSISVADAYRAQVLSKRSNSDPTSKANRGRSPPPTLLKKLRSNRSISPRPSITTTSLESSSSHHTTSRRTALNRSPPSQRALLLLKRTDSVQSLSLLTDHSDSSTRAAERRLRGMQKRAESHRQLLLHSSSTSGWNTLGASSSHSRDGGESSSPLHMSASTFVTGSRIRRHRYDKKTLASTEK